MLSYANKEFPLFNGATEINYKDYDIFLKNLKYKFSNKNHSIADFIKIKKKNLNFLLIVEIHHILSMQNTIRLDVWLLSLFQTNKKLFVTRDMANIYHQNLHHLVNQLQHILHYT